MCTLNDQHIWTFLWSVLKLTIDLKAFGEGLNNFKHIQF
jgi:hypothetical protein